MVEKSSRVEQIIEDLKALQQTGEIVLRERNQHKIVIGENAKGEPIIKEIEVNGLDEIDMLNTLAVLYQGAKTVQTRKMQEEKPIPVPAITEKIETDKNITPAPAPKSPAPIGERKAVFGGKG